jgi:hypothetical protein
MIRTNLIKKKLSNNYNDKYLYCDFQYFFCVFWIIFIVLTVILQFWFFTFSYKFD